MTYAVVNNNTGEVMTKRHSTRLAAIVEAIEKGLVHDGVERGYWQGGKELGLFLRSPYVIKDYASAAEVDDSYVGLLAWDVAKGDKSLPEAMDWLEDNGGMDRGKAKILLMKKIGDLL